MALIGMRGVRWGVDDVPLLDEVSVQLAAGERVGLLGRNGAGKSTLLKLLAGRLVPDGGEVWRSQGVQVALLDQEVAPRGAVTVFEVVAGGLGASGEALAALWRRERGAPDPARVGAWERLTEVENILSRVDLDGHLAFDALSAGMQRRALFARAMVARPDVLLLDEPTNHLDIETIVWLEAFIRRHVKTLLFVTHDRVFLQALGTRILELDRGRLVSYDCDFRTYLQRREAAAEAEARQEQRFDRQLAHEEVWIRQGIKARRTRNEGRVRRLQRLREAYRARRRQVGDVRLTLQAAEPTGKVVIEALDLHFAHRSGNPLLEGFSTVILRGDKVGIIGPNGAGKTTLLDILLKTLAPQSGSVRHGTRLQVAYFDQLREQLDPDKSVQENVAEGNAFLEMNGRRRHVIGYLQDFLFSPQRCRTPVRVLSGGERNRLLLAKLFTRPANVLVLDEPTNDLDTETLELLEERLVDFDGTLLLVSHDRAFLNNVVTRTLVFEGGGRVGEYAGGYDDWLLQRPRPEAVEAPLKKSVPRGRSEATASPPRKLGYLQQRELEGLPQAIEKLEGEQRALYARVSDPAFYREEKERIAAVQARLRVLEGEIERAYRRWEELEALAGT